VQARPPAEGKQTLEPSELLSAYLTAPLNLSCQKLKAKSGHQLAGSLVIGLDFQLLRDLRSLRHPEI
jgi:hypothetical protein